MGEREAKKVTGKNGKNQGKAAKSSDNERAPFVGYVNITLTEEDRQDYEAWLSQGDLSIEAYAEALADGYQFTFKWDATNDCFVCSISRWDAHSEDSGIIYSGRSNSPDNALNKTLYVLSRKLNWNLANGRVSGARRDAF